MKPVLVCTGFRGVFFGYVPSYDGIKEGTNAIKLKDARNVLRWTREIKGFLGLTSSGPTPNCRIGPKSSEIMLNNVTCVAKCTKKAMEAFEEAPWG